ncbi:precorrin-6A reductase [Mycoplasma sp. P36-A1]|uniref:precorrin-6A reductase n=1 Tax=Mycoplasma sp. P36-A1 TaxID=3252900 RepID=UPI003C2F2ED3
MKILVFGGTSDARELVLKLKPLNMDITVSVATSHGVEMLEEIKHDITIIHGQKSKEELNILVQQYDLIIDATHPYATIITKLLKEVVEHNQVEYIRLKRDYLEIDKAIVFADFDKLVQYLNKNEGKALVTTGSKVIEPYLKVKDYKHRLVFRVLPMENSLKTLYQANIPINNIIAMQGPFTTKLNTAMLENINAKYMISKDSGKVGGMKQKIDSCNELNIQLLIVDNFDKNGLNIDGIYERLKGI